MAIAAGIPVSFDGWGWLLDEINEPPSEKEVADNIDYFLTATGRDKLNEISQRAVSLNTEHATPEELIPFDAMRVMRMAKAEWRQQLHTAAKERRNN
jgi:hypothetical protein